MSLVGGGAASAIEAAKVEVRARRAARDDIYNILVRQVGAETANEYSA
jgi:hypothetical protein